MAPVKPTSTRAGTLVVDASTWVPSIVTVMRVAVVVTAKWCHLLRNDAIDELVAA